MKVDTEKLKAWREAHYLTQSDLAEQAGLSPFTVHNAENGKEISAKTGRALARTLGVSAEELSRPLGTAGTERGIAEIEALPLEALYPIIDELTEELEELKESMPMPARLARRLGQEPHPWTEQDKRNFRRLSAVSRELRRIFARLEAEAERELSGNVPLEEE